MALLMGLSESHLEANPITLWVILRDKVIFESYPQFPQYLDFILIISKASISVYFFKFLNLQ